ncbi:FAD-dependent oxidoreductase [Bradyrhizobium agreste]|uniref:FAD-dependent oxidoreductase n=1 Tax=Bradyrhizobium agreste TaxID=2751811 RepID=UPI0035DE1F1C
MRRLVACGKAVRFLQRASGWLREDSLLVAVAGAGIMGVSLALHFAANEMTVLLFDGTVPGSGATAKSFACLN